MQGGYLENRLSAIDDIEADRVPDGLPEVIDAHVHIFPDGMWKALWGWFDANAWPVRYRMTSEEVVRYLLDRGVGHVVALQYAHRPGIARSQNAFMAELCTNNPHVTGLASVFPGEPEADAIVEEAFDLGLAGVKLHLHVQGIPPDCDELDPVYDLCERHGKPIVMHAGREPRSPAYPADPYEICSAKRVERVLISHPRLKLCIPHFGADEFDEFASLLDRFEGVVLDSTMMLAGYFPFDAPWHLLEERSDRVMYGTDFPNIPYAWDRELKSIAQRNLSSDSLLNLLSGTARRFFVLP